VSAIRVVELVCDLCRRRVLDGVYVDTREAKAAARGAGWRTARMPNKQVFDVCPGCANDIHSRYFLHKPERTIGTGGGCRVGAFWSRPFATPAEARQGPQFDYDTKHIRALVSASRTNARVMDVQVFELETKAEREALEGAKP